jgi:hypothetical protein
MQVVFALMLRSFKISSCFALTAFAMSDPVFISGRGGNVINRQDAKTKRFSCDIDANGSVFLPRGNEVEFG